MNDTYSEVFEAPAGPIMDMMSKIHLTLRRYEKVMVSISGGSDSDILLDAICRLDPEKKASYVFFNTGLEYDATKRHLKELEEKYNIQIEWVPPVMPIPTCCQKYGIPFWSKRVSDTMSRLQKHNFKWEDKPFDVLIQEYPRCRSALRWWCNDYTRDNGSQSSLNIDYAPYLKEYIIANPPRFRISQMCCQKAKKDPAAKYEAAHDIDLICYGVRKVEGGSRAVTYKSCISENTDKASAFRPLFWLTNEDKKEYKEHYGIVNSDCYEVWGMNRTGCSGCPFGKEFEQELELIEKYEPKFYKAVQKIFGASYEYTRGYLKFREEMKKQNNERTGENEQNHESNTQSEL